MKQTVYDELTERGFVAQVAGEESLREILASGITCYIGFDPTAAALHVGHLLPLWRLCTCSAMATAPSFWWEAAQP